MFNRKTIKKLQERLASLEDDTLLNHEAIDLLADEIGAEIVECDCCGELCLDFNDK